MVEFRALGPVEAVVAGCQVDLGAPKQRALLVLLVSHVGQSVAVDVMLEALWAGRPPPSAMTSLQTYVANLRRVLEPDRAPRAPATVLRTRSPGYLLDSRVVDVDVHRFGERATAGWRAWDRGDPRQALSEFEAGLALWRGQAYAEVANAAWVAPELARLEELRLSVVEGRCAALLAVGALELAVAELEGFVRAHPLREYGCELLSRALYRAGRQADALAVLRTVQTRLAEELGIDRRPALQDLEREILNHAPALDRQPTPALLATSEPAGPAVSAQVAMTGLPPWPVSDEEIFVGREAALRQLVEALAAAAAGRGRVVTVSGEPGIGKTILLRRFATMAGVPVIWGACPEHVAAPPLWVWVQVLRSISTQFPECALPPPVAGLLAGESQHLVDEADAAGATVRQFEAIVHFLTGASRSTPLLVVLDHLQRADPASLQLLTYLAEPVPASRLLLVVCYRPGEAATLADALAAFARAGMARIALEGLAVHDIQTLASAMLHQEISRSSAERLWARTEGNPFFLREVIKLLAGAEQVDRPDAAPVPAPVREVVLQAVAALPPTAAELLSVAAVAGRHFDIDVVAEAASLEIEVALEALDTLVAAGLVREDQQRLGWFCFAHALTAEALYDTTGRLRRARRHRRIGVAAARTWTGNAENAAEIARHWLLAAELDPTAAAHAAIHAAAAARVADARLAPDEAVALWRQALTVADLAENQDLDRHPILIGLANSLYRAENSHEGLAVLVQAMEEILAARDGGSEVDTSRLATTAVATMSEFNWYPASYSEAGERLVGVLERALSQVGDPVQRALVLSSLAVARYYDGDPVRCAALSDEALALARLTADPVALAHVLHLRTAALHGPDYLDQRLQVLTEWLALPGLSPLMTARARQLRARVLITVGRVFEASVELDLAAQIAAEPHCPFRAELAWSRAALRLLAGRWREADEISRATYDLHAGAQSGTAQFTRLIQRWESAYLIGDAAELVEELRVLAESAGLPAVHGILVMALIDAGQVQDARIALRRFPPGHEDDLWLYTRCWALLAAARLGETELAIRLHAELLPYRRLTCSVTAVVISAPVAYFTAEAALALGNPEAALTDLAIATESSQKMGAQLWLARIHEVGTRAQQRSPTRST